MTAKELKVTLKAHGGGDIVKLFTSFQNVGGLWIEEIEIPTCATCSLQGE